MTTDPNRAKHEKAMPSNDPTANFSTDTPEASKSPQTQSDTRAETSDNATGAWDQQGTRAESSDRPDATANFTAGPIGRRASAVLQTSLGGYEIMGELGRGGMGVVYKAHQRGLNRTVALKMVLAGAHASDEQLKRFLAEARAVAHLQHQNIVQVFDIGENEGLPFFSLEYVDGEPLSRKLAKQPQPPKEAAQLLAVIANAMQYAHDNKIVHRDLKPANILLTCAGVPKVADFGLAKQIEEVDEEGGATRTGTVIGTPSYMAPEQARGDTHHIGPATDQYALGAMLYEMLTGRPPFAAARQVDTIMQVIKNEPLPPRQLVDKIPADIETICLKALQKEIGKRYASCGEFADDLGRFLNGEPILARPVSVLERASRWCKRNPVVASLSTIALLLLVTVAIGSTWTAYTLSAKNEKLAVETDRANNNAEKEKQQAKIAKVNEAEAKKQEGIATKNAIEAKKQEGIAKENEKTAKEQQAFAESQKKIAEEKKAEAEKQARNLEGYIKDFMTQVRQIDDVEAPQVRPAREQLLKLAMDSSKVVLDQLKDVKEAQVVPTRMAIEYQMVGALREKDQSAKASEIMESLLATADDRIKLKKESDASRNNKVLFLLMQAENKRDFERDLAASLDLVQQAHRLTQEMLANPKTDDLGLGKFSPTETKALMAQTIIALATTYYRFGNPNLAEEKFREALTLIESVNKNIDEDKVFTSKPPAEQVQIRRGLPGLARNQSLTIGSALFRTGKFDEAEPYLKSAYEQAEKAWSANPKSARSRMSYMGIAGMRAEFMAQAGRTAEAMPLFEKLAKLADDAVAFDPEGFEPRRTAALAYYRLGQWREEVGMADAAAMHKKSLEIRQAMSSKDPANERRKIELVMALGRTGDFQKADELTNELLKKEKIDSEMLLDLARGIAQASKHAPDSQKAEFLSEAISMIRRAKDQNFRDLVYLEKEIDFKPLWELAEFKAITAEIRIANAGTETP